jgi:hypothetical protein
MRSILDIRICHLLRVMRAAAPVAWSEGLPFPSQAAIRGDQLVPVVDHLPERAEVMSYSAYLDRVPTPRLIAVLNRVELALLAGVRRTAVFRDGPIRLFGRAFVPFALPRVVQVTGGRLAR